MIIRDLDYLEVAQDVAIIGGEDGEGGESGDRRRRRCERRHRHHRPDRCPPRHQGGGRTEPDWVGGGDG